MTEYEEMKPKLRRLLRQAIMSRIDDLVEAIVTEISVYIDDEREFLDEYEDIRDLIGCAVEAVFDEETGYGGALMERISDILYEAADEAVRLAFES